MSGRAGADDVARDAPKCANGVCTKLGLHRCGGCKGVMYCSAACQKVHWKQGGPIEVATSKNAKSLRHRPDQQGRRRALL
jgi:hypothetical protein